MSATVPSQLPERPLESLYGARADAFRIRNVISSAFDHVEDMRLRSGQHAELDAEWREIHEELCQAQEHLARARRLAEAKRRSLPLRFDP